MSRLLHLNGPPGIGKSTLSKRYVVNHPGVLNCDIEAHLAHGHDVVLPQMLTNPTELARFEASATVAGAQLVERFLMDTPAASAARFHRRGTDAGTGTDDPWHDQVRSIVAATVGTRRWCAPTRRSSVCCRSAPTPS